MTLTQTEIELWFHYEEIAMHFNELIMQYRLHLMGGAGAIGALLSYLIGGKVEDESRRHLLRFVVSLILLLFVSAAAALDLLYYNQLLQGAVDALLEFEREHPPINMSTLIEKRVSGRGILTILLFYSVIWFPLLGFTIWSWCQHKSGANENDG